MPRFFWQSVVDVGAVSPLARTGWPIAGTGRAAVTCAVAGAAAVTAGAASDSPASPPTAATGTTARAVTRASADGRRDAARPSGAARRAVLRENTVNSAPLTMAGTRTGVSTGAWPVREVTGLVIRPSRTEPLSHTTTQKSIVIRLFGHCVRSARVPKCRIYFAPFVTPAAAIAVEVSQPGTLPGLS